MKVNSLQAIILAAGMGSRLGDYTKNIPKAMITVHDKPLLFYTLDYLAQNNISEVIIVVGYLKNLIINSVGYRFKNMKITYVENDIYYDTNNIYSLYLTKDKVNDDVLLLECDLYYKKDIIDLMVNSCGDCNILVSPYNSKNMNGSVVKIDKNNNVKELIVKKNQYDDFDYSDVFKTVNIYKFSKDFFLRKYIPIMDYYIKNYSKNSYYELVLGALIYFSNDNFKAIVIDESNWKEIDDEKDFEIAKKEYYK
jgi:choline kinase